MKTDPEETRVIDGITEVVFIGFALNECTVIVNSQSVKYLRAVHRTALELAIQNRFGVEVGGFWLTVEDVAQLRALSEFYSGKEVPFVVQAIEAYLDAQLAGVLIDQAVSLP